MMMMIWLLLSALVFPSARPAPTYTCAVTSTPEGSAPNAVILVVSGTAPRRAEVYFRVVHPNGGVESAWTVLHNIKGVVGPDATYRELYSGTYLGQLIDLRTSDLGSGFVDVFAECAFSVQAP